MNEKIQTNTYCSDKRRYDDLKNKHIKVVHFRRWAANGVKYDMSKRAAQNKTNDGYAKRCKQNPYLLFFVHNLPHQPLGGVFVIGKSDGDACPRHWGKSKLFRQSNNPCFRLVHYAQVHGWADALYAPVTAV